MNKEVSYFVTLHTNAIKWNDAVYGLAPISTLNLTLLQRVKASIEIKSLFASIFFYAHSKIGAQFFIIWIYEIQIVIDDTVVVVVAVKLFFDNGS